MQEATILWTNDKRVSKNDSLSLYVNKQKKLFAIVPYDDELCVIVKEDTDKTFTYEKVRMISGSIARELGSMQIDRAHIDGKVLAKNFDHLEANKVVTAFVEGWYLGSYTFASYQSKEVSHTALSIHNADKTAVEQGKLRASSVSIARDLMNDIPSALNPDTFPEIIQRIFKETDVQVKILDKEQIEAAEMHGVLAVGQGSQYDPKFVELTYQGAKNKPLTALVGKGVTFDTGGLSLKASRDLSDMRMDMGGAAAVVGAVHLLAKSKAKVNVVALIPIVENILSRDSLISGDVIRYKNGITVQVGNTDAEGRLILADALIRAGELNADYVIDIATLTGAILRALGSKVAGVFGDEQLTTKMKEISDENGDFIWPMPLVDAYESYLKSHYADVKNISSKGEAGAITAALFLKRFVPKSSQWVHVDMAGRMDGEATGYYANGSPGFGPRLLADFTEQLSK